ncbi:MAG TPA: hypothetical protein VL221_05345 [Bacteroidota bacterium]|nr:hypothetical protein [Bacteroidota bacterium]
MIATAALYPFIAPGGPTSPAGPFVAGFILWMSAYHSLRAAEGPSDAGSVRRRERICR